MGKIVITTFDGYLNETYDKSGTKTRTDFDTKAKAFAITQEHSIHTESAFNITGLADPKEKIIGILMKQTLHASENTVRKFGPMCLTAIDD